MDQTESAAPDKIDKILEWTAYILFGLVLAGVVFTVAYFNGYWPWPGDRQGMPENPYHAAIAEFKTAIELEPGNPEGYRWLAKAYRLGGKPDEAAAVFEQAIANNPDEVWPRVEQGQFLLELGRTDEAVAAFERAIEQAPDDPEAYAGLARAREQSDEKPAPAEQVELYQGVAQSNPEQAWPYLELGDAYLQSGDLEQAEAAFQQAIAAEPANAEVFNKVAEVYRWTLNRTDEAIHYYRQSIALEPESGWAHAALGWALYAAGRPTEGQQELNIALRLAPEFSIIQQMAGDALAQYRSAEAAAPYYEEAVQLDPANVQARLGLARVYRRLNRLDAALAQAEEAAALASAPDDVAGAYLEQGLIYADQDDPAQAEARFARALEAAPDNHWYQLQVGHFYLNRQEQPEAALAYYDRALALAPANGWYALFRGEALFAAGQPDEGLDAFNQALALTDDDAHFYRVLGQFLAGRGQWEWVTRVFEQALAEGITDDADIYQGLGDAYTALGNHQKALVNYRQAANLNSARTQEPQ